MEVKDYQGHNKYRRIGNSNSNNNERLETDKKGNEEEDDEVQRRSNGSSGGGVVVVGSGMGGGLDFRSGRLCGWPSSRIVRVSRASGGKDRHSKVWTSKGLRDRRVRLSVNTAIQFYDLQDRLGYDQPSKAVEWLLKAAASSISELPSINTSFPESPKLETDPKYSTQLAKPGCSDNSDENSKGSGELSLSRSESRFKARERARERSAREKDKEILDETNIFHQDRLNTQINQNGASFTELLTNGMNGNNDTSSNTPKIYSSSMDYFSSNLGNPLQQSMFTFSGDHHNHHQEPPHEFSFGENNGGNSNDYNLNFTISSSASGLDGYSRGTLQSNSSAPSILPHNQRFPFIDGSQLTFFIGAAAPPVENHHHHQHQQILPGLDARLQLYSDQKGKGKD